MTMPRPTYGNPAAMEDDVPRTTMTPDELISAMLNAQREMARQISSLQRDQATQQQQFTQMLQSLTSAIQNQPTPTIVAPAANPPPTTNPHATPHQPKIPLPNTLNGSKHGAEPFLSGLHLVFHGMPTQYTADEAKVALALSLMKGG